MAPHRPVPWCYGQYMPREVLHHPDLTALLRENQRQDIRNQIADWLRDHGEDAVADAVLRSDTPQFLEYLIGWQRAHDNMVVVMTELGPVLRQYTTALAEAMQEAAKAMVPAARALIDAMPLRPDVPPCPSTVPLRPRRARKKPRSS